jgi:hypothetical protein
MMLPLRAVLFDLDGTGMAAVVANYGYLFDDEDSAAWGGDGYLDRALDLLRWLDSSGRA